ncbi:MAG: ribbon-helix-helix protein, CopG family [Polyangiaceae bacterium]|nr:ribbon-helix-helix protein, CopG family [Polyangiaceae bacterium]
MKVAISLPDELFHRLERRAKHLGISRSELLARAASAFLDEHLGQEVTASYNRAFAVDDSEMDACEATDRFRREGTRRALLAVEW